MTDTQFDLDMLMLGHFAKDYNVVDGHGQYESGGGAYFGSVAACTMGLRVGIVTRLQADDMPRLDELKQDGIQVFVTPSAETSGIENRYDSADMERRTCRPLGFAGAIDVNELPNVSARIYAITPIMAGEVTMDVIRTLAKRGPVAMDVQGFVRVREGNQLLFRPWKGMEEALLLITYLKVDRAEAEALTGEIDLVAAGKRLASYGPREIILTQSSGVTCFADGQVYFAPFTPRSLAGRTGRGDTCFASYLGRRLSASPEEACQFAGAVTTLKQEKPGPWRGPLADVDALLASRR